MDSAEEMSFTKRLEQAWESSGSLVCVGLDPFVERFPEHLSSEEEPVFVFNREIIDATADLVCAYKPQIAHYSALGAEEQLEKTIAHIKRSFPGIPVILDAKRGDIGSTAEMYAREAFERYGADAVTVNPYLGGDAIEPFLRRADKGAVILCKTSNPGGKDLQDLRVGKKALYQIVAEKAVTEWNENQNVLLVVGATYPRELGEVRSIVGEMPLLVPGIGAQSGDVGSAVVNGKNAQGTGVVINSSRGILYAGQGRDFAQAAREAALKLRDQINSFR